MKRLISFTLLVFILAACNRDEEFSIPQDSGPIPRLSQVDGIESYTGRLAIATTKNDELVIQLFTEDGEEKSWIWSSIQNPQDVAYFDGRQVELNFSGRHVIINDPVNDKNLAISFENEGLALGAQYDNRQAVLDSISRNIGQAIKLDQSMKAISLNEIFKPLNLDDGFENEVTSVYEILDENFNLEQFREESSVTSDPPDCLSNSGMGFQVCGGRLTRTTCASGYFCCVPGRWIATSLQPQCLPCGLWAGVIEGIDPCTGAATGSPGSGPGSGTGPSLGGSGGQTCMYFITITWYDLNNNIVAQETYVVVGEC